jgi:hypothetical protein
MSNDNSDRNSRANSPQQHEGVANETAASKGPTINRRNVLLGSTAIGAAAAFPLSGPVTTAAAQGATP